jgi:Phage tail assembly chaperone protein
MILHLDCVPIAVDYENNKPLFPVGHDDFFVVLKQHRNVMLSQSDWRVGVDSPLSEDEKQEWISYRTYLRDLTKNVEFPLSNTVVIQDPPISGGELRVAMPGDMDKGRGNA